MQAVVDRGPTPKPSLLKELDCAFARDPLLAQPRDNLAISGVYGGYNLAAQNPLWISTVFAF
jgi:hypothetical protein